MKEIDFSEHNHLIEPILEDCFLRNLEQVMTQFKKIGEKHLKVVYKLVTIAYIYSIFSKREYGCSEIFEYFIENKVNINECIYLVKKANKIKEVKHWTEVIDQSHPLRKSFLLYEKIIQPVTNEESLFINLPQSFLEKLFVYLTPKDFTSYSLVCKAWSEKLISYNTHKIKSILKTDKPIDFWIHSLGRTCPEVKVNFIFKNFSFFLYKSGKNFWKKSRIISKRFSLSIT